MKTTIVPKNQAIFLGLMSSGLYLCWGVIKSHCKDQFFMESDKVFDHGSTHVTFARLRAKMSQSSALHSMPWRSRNSGFCLATNGQWNKTLLALLPFEHGDFFTGELLTGGKYDPHFWGSPSHYHARLAASQRGAWHRGYVWSPRVKRTKQLGDRVTVVGCLRGGASWVTVRILREDWGTLGNIRKITTPH